MSRPGFYPFHDILGLNLVAPENSLYLLGGYPKGLPVPSADHNGKLQRSGLWHQYLDVQTLHNDDWLDITPTATATLTGQLTYVVGGNVLAGGAEVNSRGAYLIEGSRIETDTPFMTPFGGAVTGDPLLFPAATTPGRIWIYVSSDRNVRFDSVGPGAADSPEPDEITLVGVDVDALGVVTDGDVTPVTLPLPVRRLPVVIPVNMTDLAIAGSGTVLAVTGGGTEGGSMAARINGGVGPGLRVFSESPTDFALQAINLAGGNALSVAGPTTCNGQVTIDGVAEFTEGATPIALFSAATGAVFQANVLAQGNATIEGNATVEGALTVEGNATIGDDPADTLVVRAESFFDSTVRARAPFLILGASGGSFGSDPTAELTWLGPAAFVGKLNLPQTPEIGTVTGDILRNAAGNLKYRDASAVRFVMVNPNGWVSGHGQADVVSAAGTVQLDTSTAVAPSAAANLDVVAEAWVQRAVAGLVRVSLVEVGGVGQIQTAAELTVSATIGSTNYTQVVFSRTRVAADTTPRVYRFLVEGSGANVRLENARIKVMSVA